MYLMPFIVVTQFLSVGTLIGNFILFNICNASSQNFQWGDNEVTELLISLPRIIDVELLLTLSNSLSMNKHSLAGSAAEELILSSFSPEIILISIQFLICHINIIVKYYSKVLTRPFRQHIKHDGACSLAQYLSSN